MDYSRHVLRAMLGAAAVSLALTGGAAAQLPMPSFSLQQEKHKSEAEKEHDQAIDKAYQSAAKKIPDQNGPVDPWAGVRTAPPPTPAKKKQMSQNRKPQLSEDGK